MVIVLRKRALAIAALCVAVLIAVPFLVRMAVPKTAAVSAANTNWGLSFQENGKTHWKRHPGIPQAIRRLFCRPDRVERRGGRTENDLSDL